MFFPLHILFMAIVTLCIIVGVATAIFFRRKRNWFKIHKFLNIFSLFGMSAGIIMAIFYVYETGGKHIDGLHQIIGLAAFIFTGVTLLLGLYQFRAKNKIAVRTAHRLMGRFSLVLFFTAIMLGLKIINII